MTSRTIRIPLENIYNPPNPMAVPHAIVTPELARQIVALAGIPRLDIDFINSTYERIAGLERGENIAQNTIDEMGRRIDALEASNVAMRANAKMPAPAAVFPPPLDLPPGTPTHNPVLSNEPFLGSAHQDELERAHATGAADSYSKCHDCGCGLHPLMNVRQITFGGPTVCMPCWEKRRASTVAAEKPAPELPHVFQRNTAGYGGCLVCGHGALHPFHVADQPAGDDASVDAQFAGFISTHALLAHFHPEQVLPLARHILYHIRCGEVPGIFDTKELQHQCKILNATIADLRAKLNEAADKALANAEKYGQRCNEVIDLRAKLAAAEEHLIQGDGRETATRNALRAAGIPDSEAYPDEDVSAWEKSLRAAGRMVTSAEGVKRLAAERDKALAELAAERGHTDRARAERDAIAKENGERLHHISELSAELANERAFRQEDRQTLEIVKADLAAMTERAASLSAELAAEREKRTVAIAACAGEKERAEKAEESQRHTQKAREDDRGRLQQKCSDWGTYWRASDAHGVILNIEQAVELLQDALGVEVEIKDAARAEAADAIAQLSAQRIETATAQRMAREARAEADALRAERDALKARKVKLPAIVAACELRALDDAYEAADVIDAIRAAGIEVEE